LVTQTVGVVSEGKLVPKRSVQLSFNIPGTVAEVLVQEGDLVQADQALAHLSSGEQFASAQANAEFELLNAQQALKTSTRMPR
jgi:HlyD family secretion protein